MQDRILAEILSGLIEASAQKAAEGSKRVRCKTIGLDASELNIIGVREEPNGVVLAKFKDGHVEKAVCCKGDKYDLRRGIEVCLLHKLFGSMEAYNDYFDAVVESYHKALEREAQEKARIEEEKRLAAIKKYKENIKRHNEEMKRRNEEEMKRREEKSKQKDTPKKKDTPRFSDEELEACVLLALEKVLNRKFVE